MACQNLFSGKKKKQNKKNILLYHLLLSMLSIRIQYIRSLAAVGYAPIPLDCALAALWRSWRFFKIFQIAAEASTVAKFWDLCVSSTLLVRF